MSSRRTLCPTRLCTPLYEPTTRILRVRVSHPRRFETHQLILSPPYVVTFPHDPYPAGTNLFPPHALVRAYLTRFAEKHDLVRFFRFGTDVQAATFDAHAQVWTVRVAADGGEPTERQYE